MKTLTVRLPDAVAESLSKKAAELRRTQSDLVREALALHISPTKKKSLGRRMAELGGCFDGGAKDGSTNKKYLEGFGE